MSNRFTFGVKMILRIFFCMIVASVITAGIAYLLFKLELMDALWRTPFTAVFFSLLFATLIALPLMLGMNKLFFGPINELIAANRKVAQGDFSVSVSTNRVSEEVRSLIDSFNQMSKELASIELFRKDFINNFSHEFKTPISSIHGFAKQLQKDDLSTEQRAEYTNIIIAESDRLVNLSQNVLVLSKLENDTISDTKTQFSLDEQIRKCILANQLHWEAKELRMQIDLEKISCINYEDILAQLWQNLLDNAIKFSYQHGIIAVQAKQIGNLIEVSIDDQGQGMDEETRAHIFDRFYQGDISHATEGTGLGLTIAKRIVELAGGKINVSSSSDVGTKFVVVLPL
jgi:signal transduction histidine kinase